MSRTPSISEALVQEFSEQTSFVTPAALQSWLLAPMTSQEELSAKSGEFYKVQPSLTPTLVGLFSENQLTNPCLLPAFFFLQKTLEAGDDSNLRFLADGALTFKLIEGAKAGKNTLLIENALEFGLSIVDLVNVLFETRDDLKDADEVYQNLTVALVHYSNVMAVMNFPRARLSKLSEASINEISTGSMLGGEWATRLSERPVSLGVWHERLNELLSLSKDPKRSLRDIVFWLLEKKFELSFESAAALVANFDQMAKRYSESFLSAIPEETENRL